MNKLLLLTKSHIKKNKGTAIGLICLMIIAAMLVGLSLLLFLDAYPLAKTESYRLNSGDGYIRISGDLEKINDEFIKDSLGDEVENYISDRFLLYSSTSVPFGEGTVVTALVVNDSSAYDRTMARTEVVEEDTAISSSYVLLPYQYRSSGGYEIGDDFKLELKDSSYDLTVRGFTTTPYFGCNNSSSFEYILDEDTYADLYSKDKDSQECVFIAYDLKDGIKESKFQLEANNRILAGSPRSEVKMQTLSSVVSSRTFMSLIIAVSNLVTTMVVLIVILLMLVSSITNYVRENMKTIGALKAIGYTSKDLDRSLLLQFFILSIIGSVIGTACSYVLMPVIAKYAVSQMGIPYSVSFNALATVIPFVAVVTFTLIISAFALRKIKKIEPIVALREGTAGHNFKKNHFALSKSSTSLNMNLALKTMMANKKQNIITFFVVGVIVFLCVISLLMYENFNRHPKLEMMAFESCGAIVTFDYETKDEAADFLTKNGGQNLRIINNSRVTYNDEDKLYVYIIDDTTKLNNQNSCYDGRLPEHDNEVAVSGKFARDYGFEIGDEVKFDYGDNSFSYVISGLIQTANNSGREGVFNMAGAEHLMDMEYLPDTYYADIDSEEADKLIEACKDEFGAHILSTTNFEVAVEGSMTTFKGLAALMLGVISVISVVVILLVLYLLIRSLIYNKRKDYGIYKAIGYTSRDLILQTALSFMPTIILSTIVFSVISYFAANPYMNIAMMAFGVVKADFDIPIPGVAIIAAGIIVLSFLFALFESRKIKNIEAYNMLIAE